MAKKRTIKNKHGLKDAINSREQFAAAAGAELEEMVRTYQAAGYEMFLEFLAGEIETKDNKITFTARNLSKVQSLTNLFLGWGNKFKRYILKPILKSAAELLGMNDRYFGSMGTKPVPDTARAQALLLWGYNDGAGDVVPGSYLDTLFSGFPSIAQRVGGLMNQAIAAQMNLGGFRAMFRGVFLQANGGMLVHHFNRMTFDLYQALDRAAGKVYADRLGLNYAVYSGTVIRDSRPFCIARAGKIFSRDEIEGWKSLTFQGKPPIYDPYLHCGGYNCRHHLSFISDELAEMMGKT